MENAKVLSVNNSAKLEELKIVAYDYINTVESSRKRIKKEVNSILRKISKSENLSEFSKEFYLGRLKMLDEDLEELNKSLAEVNSVLKGEYYDR